ncbi:MAG: hypothetical protein VB051_12695, partial [Candidatus Pelethousia sp.]|nr:hypothetical protein [Candidatus Pelethousia sp.]
MDEQKGLLYYMETLTQLSEFWVVNYYLCSMKKAPHGGVVRIYHPNIYLKHYPFQAWTFMCHEPENVPYFMENLLDKAISLYYDCADVDLEEMLQYCYNGDNWYVGYRLLHPKPEYVELNSKMSGTLLWSVLGEKKRITDFFDIEIKYAVYSLILCLIQEKAITISSLSEILCNEKLKEPYNKYGLTEITNVEFLRQGFRIENTYYQYNIFLDPTICSPMDTMPYTFRIITDEIEEMDLSLRCDNNLAVPFDKMFSTATLDAQKLVPSIVFRTIVSLGLSVSRSARRQPPVPADASCSYREPSPSESLPYV